MTVASSRSDTLWWWRVAVGKRGSSQPSTLHIDRLRQMSKLLVELQWNLLFQWLRAIVTIKTWESIKVNGRWLLQAWNSNLMLKQTQMSMAHAHCQRTMPASSLRGWCRRIEFLPEGRTSHAWQAFNLDFYYSVPSWRAWSGWHG